MHTTPSVLPRAAAILAAAAAVAACGSTSSRPTRRSAAGTTTLNGNVMSIAQANHDMERFANCLHAHGVSGLPDPVASPLAFKDSFRNATPTLVSANNACSHLVPGQHQPSQSAPHTISQIHAMLNFARCIRSHGFPRFPDPTSTGDVDHQMLARAGINLHQPAIAQAADDCVSVTHGVITRAMVARFIAGG
jgi:hypothetical protein